MAKLVLQFKDQVLKEYTILDKKLFIGRQPDNDIVIDNVAVSKRHAKIEYSNKIHLLTDLKSTNGTFIKEKKVRQIELRDGDEITIAKHTLTYISDQQSKEDLTFSDFGGATMILDTKQQRELISGKSEKKQSTPKKEVKCTVFHKKQRKQYSFNKRIITIGKSSKSDISIQGFLLPQTAATIKKEVDHCSIQGYGGWVSVTVNGVAVGKHMRLETNDTIQIKGYKIVVQY